MKTNQIIVVIAMLLGGVHLAHAQGDAAQAEQLFREAKTLFDGGKIAEACKAWEASERMEPSLGTLTNIANCREKNGDLATAWEAYVALERRTAGIGKYQSLNDLGKKKAAELEPRLSYLTINVPDEVRVEGLEVFRGGKLIDPGAWNRALPIDGGEHTITGRAPGHEAWSTTVTVEREGDKASVEVPRFKAIRSPSGKGGTVIIDRTKPSMFTKRRKIAVGVAAGGVLALGVGGFLGLRAQSLNDDAANICQPTACTLDQVTAAEAKSADAHRTAQFADVAFGIGIAAIATGAVLWIKGAPVTAGGQEGEDKEEEGVSITPVVSGSFTGVTYGVRF